MCYHYRLWSSSCPGGVYQGAAMTRLHISASPVKLSVAQILTKSHELLPRVAWNFLSISSPYLNGFTRPAHDGTQVCCFCRGTLELCQFARVLNKRYRSCGMTRFK